MCMCAEDELLGKNKSGGGPEKSKEQSFVVAELS